MTESETHSLSMPDLVRLRNIAMVDLLDSTSIPNLVVTRVAYYMQVPLYGWHRSAALLGVCKGRKSNPYQHRQATCL